MGDRSRCGRRDGAGDARVPRDDAGAPVSFKTYYLTRMYRYSRPQEGRYRSTASSASRCSGPRTRAPTRGDRARRRVPPRAGAHADRAELNSIGDEVCRPAYRELVAYLREHRDRLTDEHRERFEDNPLRVLDCKDEACRAVAAEAPRITDRLCDACRSTSRGVQAALKEAGIAWSLEPTLVCGLDYYTRTAFEFVSPALPAAGDAVRRRPVRRPGRGARRAACPGVGFGMGLERVLMAIEQEGLAAARPGLVAFVVGVGDAGRARARPGAGAPRGRRRRRRGVRGPTPEGAAQDGRPLRRHVRRDPGRARARRGRRHAPPTRRRDAGGGRGRRRRSALANDRLGRRTEERDEHLPDRDADPRLRRAHRRARRRRRDPLRLGRQPPGPRRRHVHRPARPRGRRAGRVPSRRTPRARGRAATRRRGRRPRHRHRPHAPGRDDQPAAVHRRDRGGRDSLELLSEAETPPFPIEDRIEAGRSSACATATSTCAPRDDGGLRIRHRVNAITRDHMESLGSSRSRRRCSRGRRPRARATSSSSRLWPGRSTRCRSRPAAEAAADGGRTGPLLPDRPVPPRRGAARTGASSSRSSTSRCRSPTRRTCSR